MEMYRAYLAEREEKELLEWDHSFAVYQINADKSCYLMEVWVHPDFRLQGIARKMADKITEIAKERGCNLLMSSTDIKGKGAEESLMAQFAYGMKLHATSGRLIVTSKEI